MIQRLLALALLFACTLDSGADNEAAWNDAMLAVQAGRQAEAQAAFVKMADASTNPVFKADALEQAALCAQRLKQVDSALELAGRIPAPIRSKTLRLRLLRDSGKWPELVAAFKDEPFDRWPANLRGDAYLARGQAFYQVKDGPRAVADLTQAAATLTLSRDLLQATMTLGDTYRTLLKDDAKALAAYLKAQDQAGVHDRWGWSFYTLTTTAASMLSAAGRHAEALKALGKVDLETISGHWRSVILGAYGAAHEAEGRLVEAVTRYGEASRVQGISEGQKAALEKKVAELLGRLESAETASADLVLGVAGRTAHQVVLPDSPPDATLTQALTQAASLIREAFAANGFDVPVVTESTRDPAKPGIYLGNTAFARRQAVKVAELGGWCYRHKAVGRDVIIAGCDRVCPTPPPPGGWRSRTEGRPELGTVKAVADFLRLYAGARFLYPGATGIEFLPTPVIAVPKALDTLKTSPVRFSYHYFQSEDPFYIANNYFFPFNAGFHNWESSIPAAKYRETHPEYFALVNGQRCCLTKDWTGTWAEQYCLSNPDVQELIYKSLRETAAQGFDTVTVNHPDGFVRCQCHDCHALYGTGDDWGEKVWIFYRKMAERLQKDQPGCVVSFYAYGPTANPPKTFRAFPDNTAALLCTTTPESFAAWSQCRVPRGFSTYSYNWGTYHRNAYGPKRTPYFVEDQVRRFFENRVQGVSIDGFGEAFGLEGPTYYAFGRMWDDPANNRGTDLLDEFCAAAFAEGAVPMRRFFDELHHALSVNEHAAQYRSPAGRPRPAIDDAVHYYTAIYTPDRVAAMEAQLQRAEALATGVKARRRLALVRKEFDYLRHTVIVAQFHEAYRLRPDPASRESLLRAVDTRNALIDSFYKLDKAGKPVGIKGTDGWPELWLFRGARHEVLRHSYELNRYKESVFGWDTAVIRAAPLEATRRLTVRPAAVPPVLDAPAWEAVEPAALGPLPGGDGALPPKTSVRALRDADRLYLRFDGEWPPAAAAPVPVARDDELGRQEALEVALAPLDDRSKVYHFRVGPAAGSIYDAASGFIADPLHPMYGQRDPAWNGDWSYTTRLEPERRRWLALLSIPFTALGAPAPGAGAVWNGNFGRLHPAGSNAVVRAAWSVTPELRDIDDRQGFGDIVFEK